VPITSAEVDSLAISGDHLAGFGVRFVRVSHDGTEYDVAAPSVLTGTEKSPELRFWKEPDWSTRVFRLYRTAPSEGITIIRHIDLMRERRKAFFHSGPFGWPLPVRLTASAYDLEHFFLRPIEGTKLSTFQQDPEPALEIELTRHALVVHGFAANPPQDDYVLYGWVDGKWEQIETESAEAVQTVVSDPNTPPFYRVVNGPLPDPSSRFRLAFAGESHILHLNYFDLFGQLTRI
jgi:hypothetical protein